VEEKKKEGGKRDQVGEGEDWVGEFSKLALGHYTFFKEWLQNMFDPENLELCWCEFSYNFCGICVAAFGRGDNSNN
jgi:hypothetical protein